AVLPPMPKGEPVNRLTLDYLRAAVAGSGVVVSQMPEPGNRVRDGAKVQLWCEPKSGLQIGSGRDHDVEKNVSRPG
ncbi:MAG: PASTA domain-containing protein, partial [Bacteroidota bacterium]